MKKVPVYNNSKSSKKVQHAYEIFEKATGKVGKTGIKNR